MQPPRPLMVSCFLSRFKAVDEGTTAPSTPPKGGTSRYFSVFSQAVKLLTFAQVMLTSRIRAGVVMDAETGDVVMSDACNCQQVMEINRSSICAHFVCT